MYFGIFFYFKQFVNGHLNSHYGTSTNLNANPLPKLMKERTYHNQDQAIYICKVIVHVHVLVARAMNV